MNQNSNIQAADPSGLADMMGNLSLESSGIYGNSFSAFSQPSEPGNLAGIGSLQNQMNNQIPGQIGSMTGWGPDNASLNFLGQNGPFINQPGKNQQNIY